MPLPLPTPAGRMARTLAALLQLTVAVALSAGAGNAQQVPGRPLRVALIADAKAPLGRQLQTSLRTAGMRPTRISPEACRRESWWQADVLVVVWPDDLRLAPDTPLTRWDRPTVFVGKTGDRFARHWQLPTPSEMTPTLRQANPELERRTLGSLECLRQGHLVYLPEPPPTGQEKAQRDAWFEGAAAAVRWCARYRSDRPILRTSRDPAHLAREAARIARVKKGIDKFELDVSDISRLIDFPYQLMGSDQASAERLLLDLFPQGPDEGSPRNEWMYWLVAEQNWLVYNPLRYRWYRDPLAMWRGGSQSLVGRQRADSGDNPADAVAVAKLVSKHYGGQLLHELQTFRCRSGDEVYLWDRRRGYFRVETHFPPASPADRATGNEGTVRAAAFDTTSNTEIRLSPRATAQAAFHRMLEQSFLPLMLLEPGVQLRLREGDEPDIAILQARFCCAHTFLARNYQLSVDQKTGAVTHLKSWIGGWHTSTFDVVATSQCGPLRLPTSRTMTFAFEPATITFDSLEWNPRLPDGIESAKHALTSARKK